jgi:hypothetical protein
MSIIPTAEKARILGKKDKAEQQPSALIGAGMKVGARARIS